MKQIIGLILFLSSAAYAQNFRVDRYVIVSGGGHSQSVNYLVDGTIGQAILGHSASSNYAVDGGFWTGSLTLAPVCEYVVGDINGSNSLNGIDVTYGVTYFKGGPIPPYSCECAAGNTWYVAGDVNASCSFNGLDITYLVTYFKGGPLPRPCADCPPGR